MSAEGDLIDMKGSSHQPFSKTKTKKHSPIVELI
jgi:hypothetical protein